MIWLWLLVMFIAGWVLYDEIVVAHRKPVGWYFAAMAALGFVTSLAMF